MSEVKSMTAVRAEYVLGLVTSPDQMATLLRETETAHGVYEAQLGHRDENWSGWYGDYIAKKLAQLL